MRAGTAAYPLRCFSLRRLTALCTMVGRSSGTGTQTTAAGGEERGEGRCMASESRGAARGAGEASRCLPGSVARSSFLASRCATALGIPFNAHNEPLSFDHPHCSDRVAAPQVHLHLSSPHITTTSPHLHLTPTSPPPHLHLTSTSPPPHLPLTSTSPPPHLHLIARRHAILYLASWYFVYRFRLRNSDRQKHQILQSRLAVHERFTCIKSSANLAAHAAHAAEPPLPMLQCFSS